MNNKIASWQNDPLQNPVPAIKIQIMQICRNHKNPASNLPTNCQELSIARNCPLLARYDRGNWDPRHILKRPGTKRKHQIAISSTFKYTQNDTPTIVCLRVLKCCCCVPYCFPSLLLFCIFNWIHCRKRLTNCISCFVILVFCELLASRLTS